MGEDLERRVAVSRDGALVVELERVRLALAHERGHEDLFALRGVRGGLGAAQLVHLRERAREFAPRRRARVTQRDLVRLLLLRELRGGGLVPARGRRCRVAQTRRVQLRERRLAL